MWDLPILFGSRSPNFCSTLIPCEIVPFRILFGYPSVLISTKLCVSPTLSFRAFGRKSNGCGSRVATKIKTLTLKMQILTVLLYSKFGFRNVVDLRFRLEFFGSWAWVNSFDLYLLSGSWCPKRRTWTTLSLTSLGLLILRLSLHPDFGLSIFHGYLLVFFSQFRELRILFSDSRNSRSRRLNRTAILTIVGGAIGSFALHRLRLVRNGLAIMFGNILKVRVEFGHFPAGIRIFGHSDVVNVLNNIAIHVITP